MNNKFYKFFDQIKDDLGVRKSSFIKIFKYLDELKYVDIWRRNNPNKITTRSETPAPTTSVPICGVDSFNQSANPKRIPNDSKAATAIRIPRKNKMLGNSILLSE